VNLGAQFAKGTTLSSNRIEIVYTTHDYMGGKLFVTFNEGGEQFSFQYYGGPFRKFGAICCELDMYYIALEDHLGIAVSD
jgi:hypothetical protein